MDENEALQRLQQLLNEAEGLEEEEDENWKDLDLVRRRGEMIARGLFGAQDKYTTELASAFNIYLGWGGSRDTIANIFSTMIEEITSFGVQRLASAGQPGAVGSRKVFIVHGHDNPLKEAVARTLQTLDLTPIILHEQPDRGRTIIEKFEHHADVGFAVVLLTPDDMAYPAGSQPEAARPRARQNVILELGFFLGRLTRFRVAILYSADETFELPTDYEGVIYIPVDPAGKWQYRLVAELQACGMSVDANKLVR